MSTTQIHLALNHIPVLLSVTGALILLFGLLRKNTTVIQTALALLIAAALFALPVYFTGEGTEDSVENLPGVSENLIEEHEEMGLIALTLISITGIIALISFAVKSRIMLSRRIAIVSLIVAFISFGAFAQTAHLGGQIRHTELRSNSTMQSSSSEATQRENEKDDD